MWEYPPFQAKGEKGQCKDPEASESMTLVINTSF